MASRGWYAQKVLKLKKETSKQRKESAAINAIDCGNVRSSGIISHEHDTRDEVYMRMKPILLARLAEVEELVHG